MTNQTVEPPDKPSAAFARGGNPPGAASRAPSPPLEAERPRRGGGLFLLVSLLLIAAALAVLVLSPDVIRQIAAPFLETPPSATIAVAPPSEPPRSTPQAAPAQSGPPPVAAPPANGAVMTELQAVRAMLAELAGRLTDLEHKTASGDEARTGELVNRLSALEGRLSALIEQPVVTPSMLSDALMENRLAAQTAAQQAAQEAAAQAARTMTAQTGRDTVQEELRKAVQADLQKLSSSLADLEKRTAGLEKVTTAVAALGELEKRVQELEKSAGALSAVADLEKRVAGLEKMASAVAAIVDLEKRTAALEKAVPAMVAIPDLERRMAAMEKTTAPLAAQSRTALRGESFALGLLALRTALDRGAPYGDVLSSLRVAAAADDVLVAEVERLAPSAASGVPTLAMLRQRLSALRLDAPPPAAAAAPAPGGEVPAAERGFWDEIWHRMSSMVTVRRLDDATGQPSTPAAGDASPLLDRAAARLAVDDLAGAIALLADEGARRNLAGAQLAALDDWLRDGRARLGAEMAFANLSRRSLTLYSARPDGTSPTPPAPGDTPDPSGEAPPTQ